ncbi:biotinidase [Esox lucius]|uniref:Biotinidase n=1 Tax=Esox lucius TaxID=8010 RepID=A0A3P8X9Z0_ESOLU|nr:biotinidase [Esox lucius]
MSVLILAVAVAALRLSQATLTRTGDATDDIPGPSYVAAIYEHKVILNPEPHVPLSRSDALEHMMRNLEVYERQALRAAEQGAQIIVFPEDGIHGFNFSRLSISGYLETIPDPLTEDWNPCTEPHRHTSTEVLQRLSCMARRHRLYLVANMASVQPCPLNSSLDLDPACPPDGRWQFNTNAVFKSDGSLVARYHKHNLYFEKAFDAPPRLEVVTFDTPFAGKFGVLTCFDILFHDPAVRLLDQGVRQMVYPTAWMNQLPLLAAVQFQRAFSLGANVTLLAANIRADSLGMTGSGVFTPDAATYHHARAGDPEEGRLLVVRVPVLDTDWLATENRAAGQARGGTVEAGSPVPPSGQEVDSGFCRLGSQQCQGEHLPHSPSPSPPSPFTTSMMYDPFSFLLLRGSEGKLTVCDGPLCCHLQYQRSPLGGNAELYALGAFAGIHTVNGRYAVQVCALVRCSGSEASSCGQEVEEAESRLDFVLEGKFRTRHVYPSVLGSGMVLEQPNRVETTPDGRVTMAHSGMTVGLVTACLYGRVYDQD